MVLVISDETLWDRQVRNTLLDDYQICGRQKKMAKSFLQIVQSNTASHHTSVDILLRIGKIQIDDNS